MTGRRTAKVAGTSLRRAERSLWQGLRRLLAVVLLAEIGVAMWSSPLFRVQQVTVEGIRLTRPEEVVRTMGVSARSHWLFLSPSHVAGRVQQLPTVADVVVARKLWGRLWVRVFERQPLALLRTTGGSYWVDARGVPFWKTEQTKGLPEIQVQKPLPVTVGRPVSEKSVQAALEILYRYLPQHQFPVAQIVVDRESNLCLNMKGGLPRVKLGDSTELSRKMACAAELWQQQLLVQRAEYLDVSFVEKPVWKPRRGGNGATQ